MVDDGMELRRNLLWLPIHMWMDTTIFLYTPTLLVPITSVKKMDPWPI